MYSCIIVDGKKILAPDEVLDRVARLLEDPPTESGGFWLAGQLAVETNGVEAYPNPKYGHQVLWVPAGAPVTLVYERPLHPDPDRIVDDPRIVYV